MSNMSTLVATEGMLGELSSMDLADPRTPSPYPFEACHRVRPWPE